MDVPPELVARLRGLEEDLLRRAVRGSRTELEARLTPDFLEVGRSGRVYDRGAIVAALAAERDEPPPVIRIEDFAVRLLASDVALVTYRSVRGDAAGGRQSVTLRSSIWRREGAAWRMAFHQGTPAG